MQIRSNLSGRLAHFRTWIPVIGLTLTLGASVASADGGSSESRGDGFSTFCSQWMQKLADREQANLKDSFKQRGAGVVAEYVGYARKPLRCESRVKQPGTPGVGVLVYHEFKYRRSGTDRASARASDPVVLERTEVTEVFRYDGRRWAY